MQTTEKTSESGRPLSLTIISIILGWLALAGFANVAIGMMGSRLLAALYGITALLAAIGFWKMQPWGLGAYVAWGAIALLTGVWLQKTQIDLPPGQGVAFMVTVALIIGGVGLIAGKALIVWIVLFLASLFFSLG